MIKSNILKTVFLLVIMAVMFTATTLTAYAESDCDMYNDSEIGQHDNGEEQIDEPPANDEPEEAELPLGSLVIINSTHDGQLLGGAVFSLFHVSDDTPIAEMTTGSNGRSEEIPLPHGNYSIVVVTPANGHMPVSNMASIAITAGQRQELTIYSVPIEPPVPTPEPGRVLITVIASETGERLENVVYTIHDIMTDEIIDTISTNTFGEASAILPPGQYYKRNADMPVGYTRNMERVNFSIRGVAVTNLSVTARAIPQPTPEPTPTPAPIPQPSAPAQDTSPNRPTQAQSRVEITARAEQSGSPLNGVTFTVYHVSDNQSVGEITTDVNGKASISLAQGEYYLRNESVQYGFLREQSRIFFTVKASGTVAIEVTIQRDSSIPYVDTGNITVPKTGEMPPVMNYVIGSLLLAVALFCGFGLLKHRKPKKRKGALAYA